MPSTGRKSVIAALRRSLWIVASLTILLPAAMASADAVLLSSLQLNNVQSASPVRADKSAGGNPLTMNGQTFDHGVGVTGPSKIFLDPEGGSTTFSATIGVDDDQPADVTGGATFTIQGDGTTLWPPPSGRGGRGGAAPRPITKGTAGQAVNVPVANVRVLVLQVTGNGVHADWANATLQVTGAAPKLVPVPVDEPVILTPKPPATPRINGAAIFGVRPGHPFLYTVAASGDRPMQFAADRLPGGLTIDANTGIITGVVGFPGQYNVTLHATNSLGTTARAFKIVVGDTIALTPPMGWNSWNCFGSSVTEENVKSAADVMVKSGLIQHGWTYVNTDDYWEINLRSGDRTLQGTPRQPDGTINPNSRFPDMKGMCDYIHAKGLKAGLYSSPGATTCGGCTASYQHEDQDARTWANWGFDYIKYDWCSYSAVVGNNPTLDQRKAPYILLRSSLDKVDRDIVFSLCQYGAGNVWEWGQSIGGNTWRTTGDITDTWQSLSNIGFNQAGHEKYARPGHWNDPDMMIVGSVDVGSGRNFHPTRLTPNEQYTHVSLWCLLDAPLLIGCDMTKFDDFTLSLLTNDEVLAVNQDPLGKQAGRVKRDGQIEVWAKDMSDGSKAVGFFNRGELDASYSAALSDLGLTGKQTVRDLWRQKDVGDFDTTYSMTIPRHGVVMVRMRPAGN